MRPVTDKEMETIMEEKVTMAVMAREELQSFLDSGLKYAALSTFDYAPDYSCLQYRTIARRLFRDQDGRETIRIIFKNRKVFAERLYYDQPAGQ